MSLCVHVHEFSRFLQFTVIVRKSSGTYASVGTVALLFTDNVPFILTPPSPLSSPSGSSYGLDVYQE